MFKWHVKALKATFFAIFICRQHRELLWALYLRTFGDQRIGNCLSAIVTKTLSLWNWKEVVCVLFSLFVFLNLSTKKLDVNGAVYIWKRKKKSWASCWYRIFTYKRLWRFNYIRERKRKLNFQQTMIYVDHRSWRRKTNAANRLTPANTLPFPIYIINSAVNSNLIASNRLTCKPLSGRKATSVISRRSLYLWFGHPVYLTNLLPITRPMRARLPRQAEMLRAFFYSSECFPRASARWFGYWSLFVYN